jgi:hypothetical protein
MARAVILFLVVVSACSKGQIRSGEGAFCSTDPSDDPQYICDPGIDLICIATHNVPVTDPKEMRKWDGGVRPVFVCRLACDKTEDCPNAGDVCCPGIIQGKSYGKMAACTLETLCPVLLVGDAGAAPAPQAREAGVEAPAPDAGARDLPAADAPVDAATPADAAADAAPGDAT